MTNLHHVADSPFLLLLWLFPPNVKDLVWSDEQGAFTYPDLVPDQILSDRGPCTWAGPALVPTKFLIPKGTVYITKFGPDCGPIRIWSDQIGFVNRANIRQRALLRVWLLFSKHCQKKKKRPFFKSKLGAGLFITAWAFIRICTVNSEHHWLKSNKTSNILTHVQCPDLVLEIIPKKQTIAKEKSKK